MPIRFRCQDCRSRVKVPEGTQGKQVKCPRCGRIQVVPKESIRDAHPEADGVTVHTCVGSIHKAPKRKESLVGAGAGARDERFAGGGVPGGLDVPDPAEQRDLDEIRQARMSRKQRKKMEARARREAREHEQRVAREEAARDDQIAESRRRVEDLFATSQRKQEPDVSEQPLQQPKKPTAISLSGNGQVRRETLVSGPVESAEPLESNPALPTSGDGEREASRWTFDLTDEAYPFLRIIPWVLRITALMLIGPAFKMMLVAGDRGFSGVVCLLILFAGLALVVVTWTVGEIATAVRDIAMRRAAG